MNIKLIKHELNNQRQIGVFLNELRKEGKPISKEWLEHEVKAKERITELEKKLTQQVKIGEEIREMFREMSNPTIM